MRIYFADASNERGQYKMLKEEQSTNTLLSFEYKIRLPLFEDVWSSTIEEGLPTHSIIDSGAFTAWSRGGKVNVEKYLVWAKSIDNIWRGKLATLRYINLDHIPGSKGKSATPEQLRDAVKRSQYNADFLRDAGLPSVIEVFHQDEPFEVLKVLEDRRNGGCIALSPRNDVSTGKREIWLKQVLSYCLKTFGKKGIPPAHGLAVTSPRLLQAFPFYSADSSSWTACFQFGLGDVAGLPRVPGYTKSDGAFAATLYVIRLEIRKYKKMEYDITKLWKLRGIEWDEFKIR